MADLEQKLRALAGAGEFSHLSILASNGGFVASFSPASSWGRGHSEIHADPVTAIYEAIARAPKERKVSRGVRVHSPAVESPGVPSGTCEASLGAEAVEELPQANEPSATPARAVVANEVVRQSGETGNRPSLMGLFTIEDNDD